MEVGFLLIIRLTRAPDAGGLFRRMAFHVDGRLVARVRRGQSVDIETSTGVHTAEVRMDWLGSEPVSFEVEHGRTVTLTGALTESSVTFTSFFLHPRKALELSIS